MDGTLLNTEDIYTEALLELLALYGKGPLTWDIKVKLQGLPGPEANAIVIKHYELPLTVEEFTQKNMDIQAEKWHKSDFLPGAFELLTKLKANDIPIALGTSSNTVNFERKTRHLDDFKKFFGEHIVTGDDTRIPRGKGKPEPFIWYVCLDSINSERKQKNLEPIKPEECIIFEDGIPGVYSGIRADAHVIWVPHPEAHPHLGPAKEAFKDPNNPSPDYRDSKLDISVINNTKKKPLKMTTREPIKARFLGDGIVRLFREFEDESDDENQLQNVSKTEVINEGDPTMLSIVSIPTYFTATDLLGFIGEKYMPYITHIRILKSEKPNRFLALLKFKDLMRTVDFQFHFDGKPFNSMEPETCHVVYVKSVRIESPNSQDTQLVKSAKDSLIPFLLNDPFTSADTKTSKDKTTLVELPTCPVCLERMDADITGLVTIPCQHTFHCQCLSKWKDDTCPICRYSNNVSNQKVRRSIRRLLQISASRVRPLQIQGPSSIQEGSSVSDIPFDESEVCTECLTTDNLWICLICGNIGCSRYAPEQHSLKHFINTGHCFAMEMDSSRVWDYAGDNYVHRLVTNQTDGKLVELSEKGSSSNKSNNVDKVDEIGFEYSQLLISQLASQQEYYEGLLQEKSGGKSRRGSSISEIIGSKTITDLETKVDELGEQLSQLNIDVIPSLKNKIKAKDDKIGILSKQLNEAKIFNESLSEKVEFLTKSKNDLEAQNQDLNEQVKDLMFFLESQEKFKDEPQEVKDGTIVIQKDPKSKKSKKRR